jgi:hypothetical protein
LLLSPLFDSVGRVRMISGTYIVSGVLLAITGVILGSLTAATLTLFGAIIFSSPRRMKARPTSQLVRSSRWKLERSASPSSTRSALLPVVLRARYSSVP